ncbi:DUF2500 domain-containing protein [Vibrio maerlii]|uniref:DUF2500 domain-containing protein n=1 Tax=Vibrio maerlii TaxID=2231648 RepID=UPI000E3DB4D9|nr:DUF2500 domain-containing protein [Vibrio maerlii]
MPLTLIISLVLLALAAGWFFVGFFRKHMQGENAPEQTANVIVLDKQSIQIETQHPNQESEEYWIYVQRGKWGPKREFQVGIHYYHALNPGDKGALTYQGTKFLHFALQR